MYSTANTFSDCAPSLSLTEHAADLLKEQKNDFLNQSPPKLKQRRAWLKSLSLALKKHQSRLCEAEQKDFSRKSPEETLFTEIIPLLEQIRYTHSNLGRWMKPEKRRSPLHFKPCQVTIKHEPLGCVGIVSAWNYPIALALSPLIDAIAAGNKVMIKLSEHSPQTATAVMNLLKEVFPPEQVSAISGDSNTAKAFVSLPFDYLIYTGSSHVGISVMQAAANHLTPLTLELGGKSPCVIGKTNHFKRSVQKISFGKCINSGQTCIAPDVLFCPQSHLDQFTCEFFDAVKNMYPGDLSANDYTGIISAQHYQRLIDLVQDAHSMGAKILSFCESTQAMKAKRCFPPTLIINPSTEARVSNEEIFGPILVIKTYKQIEEILPELKCWPPALALYVFSDDKKEVDTLTQATRSGGVCINDTLIQYAVHDAPFGGVGPSGFGRYHGKEGYKSFSNPRTVVQQPNLGFRQRLYPPFNTKFHQWLINFFLR